MLNSHIVATCVCCMCVGGAVVLAQGVKCLHRRMGNLFLYFCISVFLHLCNCIFWYLCFFCIFVFVGGTVVLAQGVKYLHRRTNNLLATPLTQPPCLRGTINQIVLQTICQIFVTQHIINGI